MQLTFDSDKLLRDQRITAAEAEWLRGLASSQPSGRQTRGLWTIAVPAMVGVILGELLGAVVLVDTVLAQLWGRDRAILVGVLEGGIFGLLLGGAIGACRWAFSPYTSATPPAGQSGRARSPGE